MELLLATRSSLTRNFLHTSGVYSVLKTSVTICTDSVQNSLPNSGYVSMHAETHKRFYCESCNNDGQQPV